MIYGGLVRGDPDLDPASFLSNQEAGLLSPRAVPKRRNDFLRGRWIAKKLLTTRYSGTGMLDHIVIPDERGVPVARDQELRARDVSLSITHTAGYAAAAVVDHPCLVGIDAERYINEPSLIARDYFTDSERMMLVGGSRDQIARKATTIWSTKEAVAKALGEGLRFSLLSLRVLAIGEPDNQGWRDIGVEADAEVIGSAKTLRVWAWEQADCVVSVAGISLEGDGRNACRPVWSVMV